MIDLKHKTLCAVYLRVNYVAISVSTTAAAPRSTTASSRSTTLVLFPNGHLVQSTIANLQRPEQADRRADAVSRLRWRELQNGPLLSRIIFRLKFEDCRVNLNMK